MAIRNCCQAWRFPTRMTAMFWRPPSSDAIVTFNFKDFPKPVLDKYKLDLIHPDDFIFHQIGIDNAAVLVSVQKCRARLRNPPRSAAEYLDTLERQGLPKTVGHLRAYAGVI
ncbi:hypothetical protein [Mesorhizobium sp. ORS 3428]|uniref:hypothetical protein n=1 Tax=Mesorhizobium sp. ORS 3428 TaxID=540997 RepID=UPI003083551D